MSLRLLSTSLPKASTFVGQMAWAIPFPTVLDKPKQHVDPSVLITAQNVNVDFVRGAGSYDDSKLYSVSCTAIRP